MIADIYAPMVLGSLHLGLPVYAQVFQIGDKRIDSVANIETGISGTYVDSDHQVHKVISNSDRDNTGRRVKAKTVLPTQSIPASVSRIRNVTSNERRLEGQGAHEGAFVEAG